MTAAPAGDRSSATGRHRIVGGRVERAGRGLRTGIVVVGLLIVTALSSAPAWAHASFVASQPAPGANLAAAPGVVTLRFSEPLIDELSRVNGQLLVVKTALLAGAVAAAALARRSRGGLVARGRRSLRR